MLGAAVEESPTAAAAATATRLAVAVIRERARELSAAGRAALATQLETLAQALAAGQVTLADATRVAQIALAGPVLEGELSAPAPAPAAPAPPQAMAPPVTVQDVTAILDGQTPPKPESATPATAAPGGSSVTSPTTVLAVSRGSDGKTQLVMIGAGTKEGVAVGQRFELRRDQRLLAVATVSQARESMAVCVIIPGTGAGAEVEIKEGDAAVPVAP
jgi:hypothetical protein